MNRPHGPDADFMSGIPPQPENFLMGKAPSPVSFHLTLDKKSLILFTPLLQRGVQVKVQVGGSLRRLLEDQFGLTPEYMKERVKTVFLDGKPVDDWDTALIQDGSVLALSAAMPGLAGATLRRGGVFAGMRSQITHRDKESPISPEEGWVMVKLFNLLIPELGPLFLQRGILLSREEFAELRDSLPGDFRGEGKAKDLDSRERGENRRPDRDGFSQAGWIGLSVHFRD
jgi:hypothetical protein